MRDRRLQAIVFAGWTLAVPALAAGVALESPLWIAAGAWSLLAAVATGAIDNVFVLLHVVRQGPQGDHSRHDPRILVPAARRDARGNFRGVAGFSAATDDA